MLGSGCFSLLYFLAGMCGGTKISGQTNWDTVNVANYEKMCVKSYVIWYTGNDECERCLCHVAVHCQETTSVSSFSCSFYFYSQHTHSLEETSGGISQHIQCSMCYEIQYSSNPNFCSSIETPPTPTPTSFECLLSLPPLLTLLYPEASSPLSCLKDKAAGIYWRSKALPL